MGRLPTSMGGPSSSPGLRGLLSASEASETPRLLHPQVYMHTRTRESDDRVGKGPSELLEKTVLIDRMGELADKGAVCGAFVRII